MTQRIIVRRNRVTDTEVAKTSEKSQPSESQRDFFIKNLIPCNETLDELLRHRIITAHIIADTQLYASRLIKNSIIYDAIMDKSIATSRVAAALRDCGHSFLAYYMTRESAGKDADMFLDVDGIYKNFPVLDRVLDEKEKRAFTRNLIYKFEAAKHFFDVFIKDGNKNDLLDHVLETNSKQNKEMPRRMNAKDVDIQALKTEVEILDKNEEEQQKLDQIQKTGQLQKDIDVVVSDINALKIKCYQLDVLTNTFSTVVRMYDKGIQGLFDTACNFLVDNDFAGKEVLSDSDYIDQETGKVWTITDKILHGIKLIKTYASNVTANNYEHKLLRKEFKEGANALGLVLNSDETNSTLLFNTVANHLRTIDEGAKRQQELKQKILDQLKKQKEIQEDTKECGACRSYTTKAETLKLIQENKLLELRRKALTQNHATQTEEQGKDINKSRSKLSIGIPQLHASRPRSGRK